MQDNQKMSADTNQIPPLQNLTFDFVYKHLPHDVIKHFEERAINKYYEPKHKKVVFIVDKDDQCMKGVGKFCFYYVWQYCRKELFIEHFPGSYEYDHIQKQKYLGWTKSGNYVWCPKSRTVWQFDIYKKWYQVSEVIYNNFPENIKQRIKFVKVSENDKVTYDCNGRINFIHFIDPIYSTNKFHKTTVYRIKDAPHPNFF